MLAGTVQRPGWQYTELETADEIVAALRSPHPARPWAGGADELADRIHGAWLARCVGCVMGKPLEGLPRDQIAHYLRAAGNWPQRGYVPLLDPLPDGVLRLHDSAPVAAARRLDACPRDDDLDYTVLGLHLMERTAARSRRPTSRANG